MRRRLKARLPKVRKSWIRFGMVVAVIALGMLAATQLADNAHAKELVARYGYAGVFVIAVISGFNLVVPIPAVAFMPVFIVAGLDFWTSVLVISAGMTIADTIAFMLGRTGRKVLEAKESAALARLERFRAKGRGMPLVAMFVYASVAPLPNEVLAVPLGLMGYRVREIVPPLLAGNVLFNTLTSTGLLGVYGAL